MGGPEGWEGRLGWSGVGAQKSPAGEAGPEGRLGRWALADLVDAEQGVGEVLGGDGAFAVGLLEDGLNVGGVGDGLSVGTGVAVVEAGADGAQGVRAVEGRADVDAGPSRLGVVVGAGATVGGDAERDVVDLAVADGDAAHDAVVGDAELDVGVDLVLEQGVLGGGDEVTGHGAAGPLVLAFGDYAGGGVEAVAVAVGDEELAGGVVIRERLAATLESGEFGGLQGLEDSGTGLVPLAEGFSGVERGEDRRGLVLRLLEHVDGRGESLARGGLTEREHEVGVEAVEDDVVEVVFHGIWFGLVVGIARGDKVE